MWKGNVRTAVCLVFIIGLFACGPVSKLTSIAITPASSSIAAGESQQFIAIGSYADGSTQDLTYSAMWTSSDTSKANISNTGWATAVAAGSITVTAMLGDISGTASMAITGRAATLISIAVTPDTSFVATGSTRQFTATGTFSDHTTRDITNAVGWSSSDTAVATISTSGLATAVSAGTATIAAISGGITGEAILTITPPAAVLTSLAVSPAFSSITTGTTLQFAAIGLWSDKTSQNITDSVVWSSSDAGTATISTSGLASAISVGTAFITAASGNISATATLTVTGTEPETFEITGIWNGTYAYDCKQSSFPPESSPLTLAITQRDDRLSGTASYFGGQTSLTGSITGNNVSLLISKSSSITQNRFTGLVSGNSMSGTTLNGEGCSAPTGPAGTFDLTRSSPPANSSTSLEIIGPTAYTNKTCAAYTVEVQDGSGNPSSTDRDVTVPLSGGGLGYFYRDATCSTQINSLIIPSGGTGGTFFFKDSAVEVVTLSATDAAGHLTADDAIVTVTGTSGTITFNQDAVRKDHSMGTSAHYWIGGSITAVSGSDESRNFLQVYISGTVGGPYTCANIYYQDNTGKQWGAGGTIGGSCNIAITSYGEVGQLINGSFSGTLVPQFGGATGSRSITNGTFSVYRGPNE